MARARNIKPGFYTNEELAECSVWARLIFPGLWMLADREGRLEDRPKRIKGELLSFDAQDVEPLLQELEARKFILRYAVDGVRYIQVLKFWKHQNPHYSEKDSVIPAPDSGSQAVMKTGQLPENGSDKDSGNLVSMKTGQFQENSGNCVSMKTPEFQENSRRSPENSTTPPLLKRGSQPPDSLIPDSLIPDSTSSGSKTWKPPDGVSAAAWADWLAVRRRKKAATSERAYAAAVAKLASFRASGYDVDAIVAHSADQGWTDLYEPKPGQFRQKLTAVAAVGRSDEI